ncbi:zinc finger, CCHC-type containing protein [Tanacetum coccineum]
MLSTTMGDENPIRTLGDYFKPSRDGYGNTIELPVGNNVVPLRFDTIFWCKTDAHSMDFASNWLERFPAGSITTWEDLTTRFLAQFFPPGRTAKLHNNILMFQQHQGESLSEAWIRFKDLLQKCEIDRAAGEQLRHKNTDESWVIIENLTLYDHEGWNNTKEFVKPVKAISTPQSTSKTPDQRLLELEDHIKFLLKGSRPTPRPSSTYVPQAHAEAVYSNPRHRNQTRVRDYMAAHTKRMERFENAIFKQRVEINDRMTEMSGLLKERATSRAPEKVLVREEAKSPVTKNVNAISLTRKKKEKMTKMTLQPAATLKKLAGQIQRFNDSLLGVRVGKIRGKTYNLSPKGPVYEVILRKNITKKEDIRGTLIYPAT